MACLTAAPPHALLPQATLAVPPILRQLPSQADLPRSFVRHPHEQVQMSNRTSPHDHLNVLPRSRSPPLAALPHVAGTSPTEPRIAPHPGGHLLPSLTFPALTFGSMTTHA
jgi:hypothetical protein